MMNYPEERVKQIHNQQSEREKEGLEGYWMFDALSMRVSMDGAWTVCWGRAFPVHSTAT